MFFWFVCAVFFGGGLRNRLKSGWQMGEVAGLLVWGNNLVNWIWLVFDLSSGLGTFRMSFLP